MSIPEAIALWRAGHRVQACGVCEVQAAAGDIEALDVLGEFYMALQQPVQAVRVLQQLAAHRPQASIQRRLGNAQQGAGDVAAAILSYQLSLKIEPDNVRALNNLGQVLMQTEDLAAAQRSYEHAIALDPTYAIAWNNLGIVHHRRGDPDQAIACYERALALKPAFAQAHHNCAQSLLQLKRANEALAHLDRAAALQPTGLQSLIARGNVLQALGQFEAALASYDAALAIDPEHAQCLSNAASVLLQMQRPEEARHCSDKALALRPDFPEALSNRGGALFALRQFEPALRDCERALTVDPAFARGWSNLAHVLQAYKRWDQVIEFSERALALQPDIPEAYEQIATAFLHQKQPARAYLTYRRLAAVAPTKDGLPGSLRSARNSACDWDHYDGESQALMRAVEEGESGKGFIAQPFMFLPVADSPALHLACARAYVRSVLPSASTGEETDFPPRAPGRMRIAYLSADFHQHATSVLMAGLFERHDRARFEIMGVSFGPESNDSTRRRLERAFDRFIDARAVDDTELVRQLRELRVDIAVDLKGHTGEARMGLFARRIAPVQVSYLGHPGTTALPQMDYVLADAEVLPPEHEAFYTEKVVRLPECYQVNDDRRESEAPVPSRQELGLPDSGFVFCCFNNNWKITPGVFDVWMRLLQAVPGSVLWLLQDNADAVGNLRREARARGVDPARVIFARRASPAAHLARHSHADLFLDTLPYNAHTTAADALWAGVPLLTRRGDAFPGRVASSLLTAVGLPELVTRTVAEYEALALKLARTPTQLTALRQRLAHHRSTCPLFDTERFARHLESAYLQMYDRYRSGLAPAPFAVPPAARRHQITKTAGVVTEA